MRDKKKKKKERTLAVKLKLLVENAPALILRSHQFQPEVFPLLISPLICFYFLFQSPSLLLLLPEETNQAVSWDTFQIL